MPMSAESTSPASPSPETDHADTFSVQPSDAGNSLALRIIAIVALVFILDWAQSFVIALLLGILISYTLYPLVNALVRVHVPRLIGVTLVMVALVGGIVFGSYALGDQVESIISQLPAVASKLGRTMAGQRIGINEL